MAIRKFRKDVVLKVLIHPEHTKTPTRWVQLCEYHSAMARDCLMIDATGEFLRGTCTFCKFSEVSDGAK